MDELAETELRTKISNLEARAALVDIEIAGRAREINSIKTTYVLVIELRDSLDAKRREQANLLGELDRLRRAYPGICH